MDYRIHDSYAQPSKCSLSLAMHKSSSISFWPLWHTPLPLLYFCSGQNLVEYCSWGFSYGQFMYNIGYNSVCNSHVNTFQNAALLFFIVTTLTAVQSLACYGSYILLFSFLFLFYVTFNQSITLYFAVSAFDFSFYFMYVLLPYWTSFCGFLNHLQLMNIIMSFDFYLQVDLKPHLTWCHLQYFSVLCSIIYTSSVKIAYGSGLKVNCCGCPLKLSFPLRNHW